MYLGVIRFSSLLIIVNVLVGCGGTGETRSPLLHLNMPQPIARLIHKVTPIEAVHTQSSASLRPVYLRGRVKQRIPLLNGWIYQLQDNTGSIWVMTPTPAPKVGEEILIKGLIHYEAIPVAGEDLGEHYIEEQEQIQQEKSDSAQ
ncbi:MAG: hypothetical protein QNJ46_13410 [Leptolyngbyaceae cyanobacterium MO_188.B28]|nr:hypothetical protein [Leptolyngbyaceae cyanobacterium MO_188.B28]